MILSSSLSSAFASFSSAAVAGSVRRPWASGSAGCCEAWTCSFSRA